MSKHKKVLINLGDNIKLVHKLSGILCGHKKMALYVLISKIFKIHCKMRSKKKKKKTTNNPKVLNTTGYYFGGKVTRFIHVLLVQ